MTNILRSAGLTAAILLAMALPAAAHPLGNFTINHLTKLSVQGERIDLRYVLDMAEIPTFALMRERSPNGRMSASEIAAWSRDEVAVIRPQLDLRIDGVPVEL